MQATPRLLGAMAAVLVAGVTGGAVLGTVPPMRQLAASELIPESGPIEIDRSPPQRALPDHYPITTPEGRFEVHQLAERGVYSQARYADPYLDQWRMEQELIRAEFDAAHAAHAAAREEAYDAAPEQVELALDSEPLPPIEQPGELAFEEPEPTGGARRIDVVVELASLN